MLQSFEGALLLADISGFTRLSEIFRSRGLGAEELKKHINAYFRYETANATTVMICILPCSAPLSRLLAVVERHEGDVIKFAGDAIIVLWATAPAEGRSAKARGREQRANMSIRSQTQLSRLTAVAASCGCALNRLGQYTVNKIIQCIYEPRYIRKLLEESSFCDVFVVCCFFGPPAVFCLKNELNTRCCWTRAPMVMASASESCANIKRTRTRTSTHETERRAQ